MNSFLVSTKGKYFPNDTFKASLRTTSTTTTTTKKTRYRIKNQNSKPQDRIQNQTSKIPNPKIHQNPRSKIQTPKSRSKSVETCLPNTCLPNKCVCPPVCPTASSPKAQTFEPPLTIHFDVLFAQFFLVIKAAVLYMEFWFMTGLPQESRQFFAFCKFTSTVSKMSSWKSPKKCAKFGS